MKKSLLFLLPFLAAPALSECYITENYRGVTSLAIDGYQISEDGLSNTVIELTIEGEQASINPANGVACFALAPDMAVCTGGTENRITNIETYSIDINQRKVIMTQVRNGLQELLMSEFNGAKVFVGDITGTCN